MSHALAVPRVVVPRCYTVVAGEPDVEPVPGRCGGGSTFKVLQVPESSLGQQPCDVEVSARCVTRGPAMKAENGSLWSPLADG